MNNKDKVFPLAMLDNIKAHPENYRLLERIPLTIEGVDTHFPIQLNKPLPGEKIYSVVFLDTETTGIDATKDHVIELGLVKATFSLDRKLILSVDKYYDEFEDPKVPIPEEIVNLTGITDDMVKDHSFDEDMVAQFLVGRPLIVAHNAGFDRPFFENRFPSLANLSWACSLKEVPWTQLGFPGSKLEYLSNCIGFFYDAHRAYVDCLALLWVLYKTPEAFEMLVKSALTPSCKMVLHGNTFAIKDVLKEKQFRFDGTNKTWGRFVKTVEEAQNLKKVLTDTYKSGEVNFEVELIEFNAKTRYKLNSKK